MLVMCCRVLREMLLQQYCEWVSHFVLHRGVRGATERTWILSWSLTRSLLEEELSGINYIHGEWESYVCMRGNYKCKCTYWKIYAALILFRFSVTYTISLHWCSQTRREKAITYLTPSTGKQGKNGPTCRRLIEAQMMEGEGIVHVITRESLLKQINNKKVEKYLHV